MNVNEILVPHEMLSDTPSSVTMELFGRELPARWGRMDALSRLLAVKTGLLLRELGNKVQREQCGMICGTGLGTLRMDLDFIDSMNAGPMQASPMLFSNTLPNIAPAESAVIFGLKGPVYAVYHAISPLNVARDAAELWLADTDSDMSFIVCAADYHGTTPCVTMEFCA